MSFWDSFRDGPVLQCVPAHLAGTAPVIDVTPLERETPVIVGRPLYGPETYGQRLRAAVSAPDYLTRDGDMLDVIARQMTGRETGIAALLARNPHLAREPAVLAEGLDVRRPPAASPRETGRIRLWGRT